MHDTQDAAPALPLSCRQWLQEHAPSLDRSTRHAGALLPLFARHGLLREDTTDAQALDAVAEVSAHSLAAGGVLAAQMSFMALLRHAPNVALSEHLMPALLDGSLAGSPALTPAFAHLAHGTALPVRATETPRGWKLNGAVPWAVNLQHDGHAVALPVAFEGMKDFCVVVLGSEESGLTRTVDPSTVALRGLRAAALRLEQVHFREDELLHVEGSQAVRQALPLCLGLQCAMALGVARGALAAREDSPAGADADAPHLHAQLAEQHAALAGGFQDHRFAGATPALLKHRARLLALARTATRAERGENAFLAEGDGAAARRVRETTFLSLLRPASAASASPSSLSTSASQP